MSSDVARWTSLTYTCFEATWNFVHFALDFVWNRKNEFLKKVNFFWAFIFSWLFLFLSLAAALYFSLWISVIELIKYTPPCWGVEPQTKFSKRVAWQDLSREGVAGKERGNFFQGVVAVFTKKKIIKIWNI